MKIADAFYVAVQPSRQTTPSEVVCRSPRENTKENYKGTCNDHSLQEAKDVFISGMA